jgi:hypothetical protein
VLRSGKHPRIRARVFTGSALSRRKAARLD